MTITNLEKILQQLCANMVHSRSLSQQLCETQKRSDQLAQEYSNEFERVLREYLSSQAQVWCTRCLSLVSASDIHLVFTKSTCKESGGYENSCYGFHHYERLGAVCTHCYQYYQSRNGWYGEYNTWAKDQESFKFNDVTLKEDKYYVFDRIISTTSPHDGPIPKQIVEQLAKELGISSIALEKPHRSTVSGQQELFIDDQKVEEALV